MVGGLLSGEAIASRASVRTIATGVYLWYGSWDVHDIGAPQSIHSWTEPIDYAHSHRELFSQ